MAHVCGASSASIGLRKIKNPICKIYGSTMQQSSKIVIVSVCIGVTVRSLFNDFLFRSENGSNERLRYMTTETVQQHCLV